MCESLPPIAPPQRTPEVTPVRYPLILVAVIALFPSAATAQTTLFNSNGFETGYTAGTLNGQQGWTVDGTAVYNVQSAFAAGGTGQAVQVSGGATSWAFPALNYTPQTGELVRIQASLARNTPSSPTGSFGYSIDVFDSFVDRTTRFGLVNNAGAIHAFVTAPFNTTTLDFEAGQPVTNVLITNALPADTFFNFDVFMNYANATLRLFINGVDFGDIPFADPLATDIADADFQVSSAVGATDSGFLDNYIVTVVPVPEPGATLGVAAVVGAMVVRRKRRAATRVAVQPVP